MIHYLDLFSGIGGFALGAQWAGLDFDGHYFSEIDEYAISIYKKHFPKAVGLGDITKINYSYLPRGNWYVSGGFPCQSHSVAGKRKGGDDERDLWPECARAIRELRPRWALFENVPDVLTTERGRYFNRVISDISQSGYDAEWRIISASSLGAPHRRNRLWLIAYPQGLRWNVLSEKLFDTVCEEISKKTFKHWSDIQFKTTGVYSVELQEGDEDFICRRVDDGIPSKLDKERLKCLGNAIVPQIASLIWMRIGEINNAS